MGKYDDLRALVTQPSSQATANNIESYRNAVLSNTNTQTEGGYSKYADLRNPTEYLAQKAARDAAMQKQLLGDTLNSVMRQPVVQPVTQPSVQPSAGVDFKADQAKKKQASAFQGKLPAADLLQTPQPTIQSTLKDKVPAANLVQQTGGAPANASQIPGISEYENRKKAIEESNAPEAVKAYSNIMNYIAFGNPLGQAVSNSFAGNSGVTRRDSTGNALVDKATDVINNLITPVITPTGAPLGQGIIGSSYETVGNALQGAAGQKLINGASKVVMGSPNVARVGITEGIAGAVQGAGLYAQHQDGSQSGQDFAKSLLNNAGLGAAGGALLGGVGAALGEGASALISRFSKRVPEVIDNVEVLPAQQNNILALPEGRGTIRQAQAAERSVLSPNGDAIINPTDWTPEPLGLPEANIGAPTTARRGTKPGLNAILEQIKPVVDERMTPPYENMNELAKWIQTQFRQAGDEISLNEIRTLSYEDMRQVAEEIRKRITVESTARQVMKEAGYDYDKVLSAKSIPKDLAKRARKTQEVRDTYGLGNKVKSVEDRYKPIVGRVAEPETVIAKPGVANVRASQGNAQTASLTREQEVMNKVNAKQPLTQEDIEFALSDDFNQNNLFPESTPTESTYVKPRQIKSDTPKTAQSPAVKVPVRTTSNIKTSVTQKAQPGERGFAKTLRNSGKAPEAVKRMNTKYDPITNEGTLSQANKRIDRNMDTATKYVLREKVGATAESVTTAQRLIQEYTKAGDHETAALIAEKAASDLTNAGQTIQAASMWDRLSPEGMLLRVQREISKVNETLGPAEEKLSLSAADAAKITNTGEQLQGAQKVRDLSQEVLDMVSSKKPGESLTAEEKNLLAEFEKQVKSVNNSVKPFLKTAKRDAEKIAKIKPENRTRDQVVQYLDQKAVEAQARIAKRRNISIVAQANNPVVDYSIIAAAKIARGVRTFSDLTEDMVKIAGNDYKKYADEVFTKATQRFRRENGLPTTTDLERVIRNASKDFDETSKNALRRMAAEIGYYTDENLKRELTQDLQQIIKTYGRSTLGEKIAGVQTAGQLLSVPTFLRNTLGNAGQFGLEKINKVAAVPIDWTLSKFTGKRTIQFMPKNQEKLWKNFASGTGSGWREVNAMGTLDSYNVKPSVFSDKNPLKYLTKLTGASLQGMDYAAYKAAYGDVMATYAEQLGRAQGMIRREIKNNMPELLSRLDDNVRALADQAGLYATYQDDTLLSRAAQGTKKSLNAASDKLFKAAVEKGLIPRSLSLEGFGLGDIVLKYAKTPANLVMRGIDYSPLGFIRAIGEFMPLLKNGGKNFNQFNATRALSRAITGTVGLTAVGYAMADAGLLTGASSSDADKRSIEEQSGQGAYKANLSGIYRWIMSGFDKEEAKFKKGDKLIDYAWLQPAAISLGMGVNFRNAQNSKKPGESISNVELAKRSIIGGLRTVLENPMVTGLSDVVGGVSDLITRQDTKKLTGIVKGIPSSFVPAILGQARNVTDNKQRVTYDKSVLKEMMNLVKNRVPGLSSQLPVSYDSLGNERQRIQGGRKNSLGQYLNSFLNPTKVTTYSVSPEAKVVLDILNASNDSSVLPRVIQKYVSFKNEQGRTERYELSNKEYSELQKKTGQRVLEEIQYVQDYLEDSSIDIAERAEVLKKILEYVGTETREEFREEKGLNESE